MQYGYNFNIVVREMGGQDYHLKGRERIRMRVRIRDGFTCQTCGATRTIRQVAEHNRQNDNKIKLFDVHHLHGLCGKNSRGYDAASSIEGLVTLCHKCHYNHHHFRGKHLELGQILNPNTERDIKIIEQYKTGISGGKLAKQYGVSHQRIYQILKANKQSI